MIQWSDAYVIDTTNVVVKIIYNIVPSWSIIRCPYIWFVLFHVAIFCLTVLYSDVNSIPDLMSNFRIGIVYLKRYGIDKHGIAIEVCYTKFKCTKYFFLDNPTWNINYSK